MIAENAYLVSDSDKRGHSDQGKYLIMALDKTPAADPTTVESMVAEILSIVKGKSGTRSPGRRSIVDLD